MSTKTLAFYSATPGRIGCTTAAFGLAAPAIMALVGPGPYEIRAIPVIALFVVVGSIFTAVLSVEDFPMHALMLAMLLPFAAFFYFMGLELVTGLGAAFGILLLVAAMVPLAAAVAAPRWSRDRAPSAPPGYAGAEAWARSQERSPS